MKQARDTSFSAVRSYVWPIYPYELKKLVPMLIMLFCVCFNYSILRNLKDAIIITENGSGAAIIPFIKGWVMLPAAVISTIIFTKLSNHFSRKTVLQVIVSGFLLFFFLFAFVLYPNRALLNPHHFADFLEANLPGGCKAMIGMVRHWTLTGFYVVAELWGSIVLSVLFWSFANEITKIHEAPRFYSVLSIGSNTSPIIAGQVAVFFTTDIFNPNLFFGSTAWEQTLMQITLLVIGSGIMMLLAFRWITRHALDPIAKTNEAAHSSAENREPKKKKLGFRDSILYIARSKYLLCIAMLVISYNLVIALVEVIWKDQLRELYPSPQHYNTYMNHLTSLMGVISTGASLLMVGILSRLGWTKTALLTPIVLLITSVAFFFFFFADTTLSPIVSALLGTTPLALAVLLGSIQNCFSKAAKYSLFDTTKEMAFIPLDKELKLKGKAAIDGIGSRFGKSASSYIHQGFYFVFCSLHASAPYVALVLIAVIVVWIIAVLSLGKQFTLLHQVEPEEPQPTPSTEEPAVASSFGEPALFAAK